MIFSFVQSLINFNYQFIITDFVQRYLNRFSLYFAFKENFLFFWLEIIILNHELLPKEPPLLLPKYYSNQIDFIFLKDDLKVKFNFV